jgi:hypothetical protein
MPDLVNVYNGAYRNYALDIMNWCVSKPMEPISARMFLLLL